MTETYRKPCVLHSAHWWFHHKRLRTELHRRQRRTLSYFQDIRDRYQFDYCSNDCRTQFSFPCTSPVHILKVIMINASPETVLSYYQCREHRHRFFFKFGRHMSFLWGQWYPCCGVLVMSLRGFKARVGSLTHTWWRRA